MMRQKGWKVAGAMLTIACSTAAQADLVITEASSNSSHPGGAANGDWWELTNTGATSVDLTGFSWDDDSLTAGTSIFPAATMIGAGESIVITSEDNDNLADFVAAWGGGFTAISSEDFGGTDDFSGLGAGGDQIALYDSTETLIDIVNTGSQSSPNAGITFNFDLTPSTTARDGVRSALGDGLSFTATGDGDGGTGTDIGSPGVIPEPASLVLIGLGGLMLAGRRRMSA